MAQNYIIVCDDYLAINEYIDKICQDIKVEYDKFDYDLDDDGLYSIVDELSTISLFDNLKVVVVKSIDKITNCSAKAFSDLLSAMNNLESENVLIMTSLKVLPDNERISKLKKYSSLIDLRLKNINLKEYIDRLIATNGFSIDENAVTLLLSYNLELSELSNDLKKLMCYDFDSKKITEQDVKFLVSRPLDDNVYQLIEAVLDKNYRHIFSSLKDFKLQNMPSSYIVSLLINKFQELYNTYILSKANMSQADIANVFHVSSGRAYYMLKNIKKLSLDKIKQNLELLNDLDYNIKSGKLDQNIGLELYLLK